MYQYCASGNWKCINIVPVDIGNESILCQWKLEMYQYKASGNWKCINIVPVEIGNVSI
jgi:3-methyladenine DNA glycosylase Mpg